MTSATSDRPKLLTPNIPPDSAADPHAAVFVRSFDLKESVLLGFVAVVQSVILQAGEMLLGR